MVTAIQRAIREGWLGDARQVTGHLFGDNPGVWFILAIVLAVFVLPDLWGWPVIALGAVIEVAETFVWIRLLGRVPVAAGPQKLIGADARVTQTCDPIGEVRVRGEAWRARCEPGADAGRRVRVLAREGITLVVEPAAEP